MCADCKHEDWLRVANDTLDSGSLSSSDDSFLSGVVEWIGDNKHVTDAQIDKIKEKADKAGIDHE